METKQGVLTGERERMAKYERLKLAYVEAVIERCEECDCGACGYCLKFPNAATDAEKAEDLGLDSLDTIELAMALEEEFGIDIDDEEVEAWSRVHDVVEHEDGTITVSPSVLMTSARRRRHGFLRRGVWEPCGDDIAPVVEPREG